MDETAEREQFRRAYEQLAETGKCDSWGGGESERVWQEWLAAGKPADLTEFITRRANAAPGE